MKTNIKNFPKLTPGEHPRYWGETQEWKENFIKELQDAQGGIPDDPKTIVLRDGEVYINIKEVLGQ